MTNIKEYFNNLYNNAKTEKEWDAIADYETEVYEMEDGFKEWAKENNIDLTAIDSKTGETILQHWAWDMEE